MKRFIMVTGAPASGKLTVATEFCELTGATLFHNHLTIDLALAFFPFGTDEYDTLVRAVREHCISFGFAKGIDNMVFTFCFEGEVDYPFIRQLESIAANANAEMLYAHLDCERAVLRRRVGQTSRLKHNKMTSPDRLNQILSTWQCEKPIPGKPVMRIDNSGDDPHNAAMELARRILNS